MQDNELLAQLPVRRIKVWVPHKHGYLYVLVDGDYDGEYFAGMQLKVLPSGYVIKLSNRRAIRNPRTGLSIGVYSNRAIDLVYLHHLILPKKPGYIVTHLNGDKLDNRSCNLAYTTWSKRALQREQALRERSIA